MGLQQTVKAKTPTDAMWSSQWVHLVATVND
jgi:hypothetical protein